MKARHILPFVILCSLLLSCKDDRPFEEAYLWQNNASLTASLTTLLFEADASTQTVAITTNSGYGISVDQTWLTVERAADNQTLTVSVQANTTSTTRNATITINASGKSQTINVSQSGLSLYVSRSTLTLAANASSDTIKVTASGNYSYSSSASWLTITQSSDKTTLTVSAEANTGTSERTATITLTLGSLTQTISVTQQAAANTYDEERTFTVTGNGKTVTFKMIKVEGGTFQMGRAGSEDVETPVHSVTLTKTYYMCETELTQALWYAIMGLSPTSDGSRQWDSTYGLGDNYPAYYISYEDCPSFLSALNSKLSSQLGNGEQFRFPTEAEWEFAAKGGNKSKGYTYSGSNTIGDVAWYESNSNSTTHPVKTKSPNELGLYDMSGNVDEWCYDWYDDYSSSAQTDPTGFYWGSYRVLRGGSWPDIAGYCRVAFRSNNTPRFRYNDYGFRLCLGAPIE